MERAVFRVHGQNRGAGRARGRHQRLAGHDERLLVREGQCLAELHGFVCGREADRPHDAAEDDVGLGKRRHVHEPLRAEAHGESRKFLPDARGILARGHRHDLWAVRGDRGKELLEIRPGRHRDDLESLGETGDDGEGRIPDRASRAQEGDALLHRGRAPGTSVRTKRRTGEA